VQAARTTMRKLIIILTIMFSCQISLGQNKAEQTFQKAIKEGISTAPDFVVLTVRIPNTRQSKEIITDVTSLFEAYRIEHQMRDYDIISEHLLKNAETRVFEFRTKEALKRLNFDNYELKSADKIEKIVSKENIIDSLPKITQQRKWISDKFYEYSDKREGLLEEIKDSIQSNRELTIVEKRILSDLTDQYYDCHYNQYAEISEQGKALMKIWNSKIKPYKHEYKKHTDELERLENKFFREYHARYGLNFCHIVFKYGAIFNSNCENGMLEFNQVIN
jgi:hypothetical protein